LVCILATIFVFCGAQQSCRPDLLPQLIGQPDGTSWSEDYIILSPIYLSDTNPITINTFSLLVQNSPPLAQHEKTQSEPHGAMKVHLPINSVGKRQVDHTVTLLVYDDNNNLPFNLLWAKVIPLDESLSPTNYNCFQIDPPITLRGTIWAGVFNPQPLDITDVRPATTAANMANGYYYYGTTRVVNPMPPLGSRAARNIFVGFPNSTKCDFDCSDCVKQQSCIWCMTTSKCVDNTGTCTSWTRDPKRCSCSSHKDCLTCTKFNTGPNACAWCEGTSSSTCVLFGNGHFDNCTSLYEDPAFCNTEKN